MVEADRLDPLPVLAPEGASAEDVSESAILIATLHKQFVRLTEYQDK